MQLAIPFLRGGGFGIPLGFGTGWKLDAQGFLGGLFSKELPLRSLKELFNKLFIYS